MYCQRTFDWLELWFQNSVGFINLNQLQSGNMLCSAIFYLLLSETLICLRLSWVTLYIGIYRLEYMEMYSEPYCIEP